MRRYIPEVRALYERVRRPAIMVMVGLGLTAPMGLTILRPDAPVLAAAAVGAPQLGVRAVAAEAKPEPATTSSTDSKGGTEAAKAEERERSNREAATTALVTRYAKQFRIPVSLAEQIHSAAVAEGIEPRIAFGLVQTESSFRRTAISSVGAVGYTQLLPSTARWIAPGTTRSDLFNTKINLRVGFKYLNYLLDKYDGNVRLALTAYNRGPGTVDRLLRQGRNPENGYATKVLRAGRG